MIKQLRKGIIRCMKYSIEDQEEIDDIFAIVIAWQMQYKIVLNYYAELISYFM